MVTQKRRRDDADDTGEISFHALDKRIALIDQTVTRLAEDLEKINKNIARLVWLVATTLILAILKFGLSGGFNVAS